MNTDAYLPNTAAAQQTATVTSSASLLTALLGTALHTKTDMVQIAVETDAVRMCPSGTVPTASLGAILYPGQIIELTRAEADAARVIRVTTNATLQVIQYIKRN
jgi:hypothetical protein